MKHFLWVLGPATIQVGFKFSWNWHLTAWRPVLKRWPRWWPKNTWVWFRGTTNQRWSLKWAIARISLDTFKARNNVTTKKAVHHSSKTQEQKLHSPSWWLRMRYICWHTDWYYRTVFLSLMQILKAAAMLSWHNGIFFFFAAAAFFFWTFAGDSGLIKKAN